MGYNIALTGLVVFLFLGYCYLAWKGKTIGEVAAFFASCGLIAIPIGLIIQIWQ